MKSLPQHAVESAKGIYVDTLRLQPADVLMTRGTGKSSNWLARFTAGPFSHAAIVVNRALLFESDDVGVGYSALGLDRIERGKEQRYLAQLQGATRAVVLRHPLLARADALALEGDLVDALYPYFGREYPEWAKLASAARGGRLLKRVARVALRMLDKLDGTRVWVPGPFCSQLVADALMQVLPKPLTLFVPSRAPADVSPNALLESELRPVPEAVRVVDPDAVIDEQAVKRYKELLPTPSRQESTGVTVETRVLVSQSAEKAKELVERVQQFLAALASMIDPE